MKILYLTHRLPYPPNDGARSRPFNIIKYLASKHKITVVSLCESKKELKAAEILKGYVDDVVCCVKSPLKRIVNCLLSLFFPHRPFSLAYFYSKRLKNLIRDKLTKERFDLIFVYSSSMAQYVVNEKEGIPKVLDLCDVDSAKWSGYSHRAKFPFSFIYKLEGIRLKRYEILITKKFKLIFVISSHEKELLEAIIGKNNKIDLLPNGVDYQFFNRSSIKYTHNTLIFTGVMNYYANVDAVIYFYKKIFPFIKKEIKDVKFFVVGRNPDKTIQKLKKDKNVVVTGTVDDVRPYFEEATVCVAPLNIARGIQTKILESMAMKIPVIATKKAWEGINAIDGIHGIIEDNAEIFAKKTIDLLNNKDLRDKITTNARDMIEKNYNWQEIISSLNNKLCSLN